MGNWYAVRSAPGAQRCARSIEGLPERRRLESVLERNLRNAGIDCYMPSFWDISKHKRTKKLRERRLPLLVGYAFVYVHGGEFERIRRVDGVASFLKQTREGGPTSFHEEYISTLMLAEDERRIAHEHMKEQRRQKALKHRRNQLRKELGGIFPKGRKGPVFSLQEQAEREIESLPEDLRYRVTAILRELNSLTDDTKLEKIAIDDESPLENIALAS